MSQVYTIAHIKNGVVENTCVWDKIPNSVEDAAFGSYEYVNVTGSPVSIGWEYAAGVFTNPEDLNQVWEVPASEG
jgi:hypothetical protein